MQLVLSNKSSTVVWYFEATLFLNDSDTFIEQHIWTNPPSDRTYFKRIWLTFTLPYIFWSQSVISKSDALGIIVDKDMKTSDDNVYACGDATGGLLQISKSVYEGAKAGTEIVKHLKGEQNWNICGFNV